MIDEETLRLRRGLGTLFVAAAVLYLAIMAFASLYNTGGLPQVRVSAARFSQLFFGHFLFVAVAPLAYLGVNFRRTKQFRAQALVDCLTGLLIYMIFFALVGVLVASFAVTPWLSLLPGLFLLYYGLRVRHGRQIWALLDV